MHIYRQTIGNPLAYYIKKGAALCRIQLCIELKYYFGRLQSLIILFYEINTSLSVVTYCNTSRN